MTETVIQGRRVRLLESWTAPGLVLDRWEDLAETEGSWQRVGVVVLVTDGAPHAVDEDPNMPWDDTWAVGYTVEPSADPVERFAEAVRQERARAEARLGGPLGWTAIYERPSYPGTRTGPGSWVVITSNREELGIVWTNHRDAIGFIPSTDAGIVRNSDFISAFQAAAGEGTPVETVWDYWSTLAGLGLCSLPEQTGPLEDLRWGS